MPLRLSEKDKLESMGEKEWTPGYEYEYCQYESELQDLKKNCKKHPTHDGFIPISDFNKEHLPQGHRDDLVWNLIQTLISLTVRVVVIYTSRDRLESGYVNSDRRGSYGMTFGSGWVRRVYRMSTGKDGGKCPCKDCEKFPDKAKTKWAQFIVITAKHLVFNSEECKQTRCDVGFDRDEDRGKCHKLDGLEVWFYDIKFDYCVMCCVSHSEDVINNMEMMVSRYRDLTGKLKDKYKRSEYVDIYKHPVICVSHPHGMAKHVTVGMCTGEQEYYPYGVLNYNTKTCPGSSGGIIFKLGTWRDRRNDLLCYYGPHSKSLNTGENQSGLTWWF